MVQAVTRWASCRCAWRRRLLAVSLTPKEELFRKRLSLHTRILTPLAGAWQRNGAANISLDWLLRCLYSGPALGRHRVAVVAEEDSGGGGDGGSRGRAWIFHPFSLSLLLAACWNGPTERNVNEREFLLAAMVGNIERMEVGYRYFSSSDRSLQV